MHTQLQAARLLAPFLSCILALCWATSSWGQGSEEWRLNLGGVSHHAEDTAAPGHHWNEVNPGVGVERRQAGVPVIGLGDPWHTIATAGLFVDSRDYRSAYAGLAATYELAAVGRTRIDGGAGAFLFYRSRSWDGRRQWSPAVLPALNFTDVRTGLGFEILWRPPHTDGPSTLYLQVTFRFGPSPARPAPTAATMERSEEEVRQLLAWKMRRNTMLSYDAFRPDTRTLGAARAPR